MTRPTHIRKRDGRVVPFDEGKIADAIYRAALAVGGEDRFLAEELASVVTLFLGKMGGAARALAGGEEPSTPSPALPGMDGLPAPSEPSPPPTIEQVQDVVEKVLIETGHAKTAKAYILYRDRRSRLRDAAAARLADSPPTLFDDRLLVVDDPALERSGPFASDRLVRAVAAETGLRREAAAGVVQGVEERLRRSKVQRLPAPLLTSLVDAELLDRGLLEDPRRRSGVALSRHVIEAALAPKGRPGLAVPPEEAARRLGGEALRAYALADVLPGDVARAHLEGSLHVHGLSRPAALLTASLSLDAVKVAGVTGAGGRTPARATGSAARFLAQVGRASSTLRGYVTHGIGIPACNVLMAPLVAEGRDADDPSEWAEEAEHLLLAVSGGADGVPVDLDLCASVPSALAGAAARGGAAEGSLRDHAAVARAFARAVVAARIAGDGLPPRAHL
ncbi:MAG: ATP cone domain-containing protein, partial [Planctomycetota bacterium]